MLREELICSHMPFAEELARRKRKKYRFVNVCSDQLQAAAYEGLVEAAGKYDPAKGPFQPFAAPRINGAIDDYVRCVTWSTRRRRMVVESLPESLAEENDSSWAEDVAASVMHFLPEEGRRMFRWYYLEGLTLREIGQRLGLTGSAVSKRLKQYREKLLSQKESILDYARLI